MKDCPTCKRIYEDDTLAFCLDDGARLSTPYDPRSTLRGTAARDTDPPRTEILPPELAPAPLRSTIMAVRPLAHRTEGPQSQPTEKPSGSHWIVLSGTLAFIVVGLVIALGYLAWKANHRSLPEPSRVSSSVPTNSNVPVPVNANKDIESKSTDNPSFQLLDGVWEGEAYQSDTKTTWTARLSVQEGKYAIDYPNIPCRGRWTLIDNNTTGARFIESITQGIDRCSNNSRVMVQKVSDSEISCKYKRARSRVVIATVVLSRKAHSTEKK